MNRYLILFQKLFTFEELKQLINDRKIGNKECTNGKKWIKTK